MVKRDFDKLFTAQAEANAGKRLLLHCCCAPCSSACLERLKDYFSVTALFYNPNIEGGEYERRKAEIIRFINETGWADFIDCDHDEEDFYCAIAGLENEKEGGARCVKCFELRLEKTKEIAEKNGFDFFTTTLTISPMKNAQTINMIGERLGGEKWVFSDFKKRNGYFRSIELSKKHCLYRQNFCGCKFSRKQPTQNNL